MTSGRDEMLSRGHIDYEAEKDRRVWYFNKTGGDAASNLTVRDYFAAKAMAALIPIRVCKKQSDVEAICADAYTMADAMMKERAK